MKSIKFLFLIFSFSPAMLFSQVDISVFNDISGTWQGTYSTGVQEYQNKETLICKWMHNHNFFQIDILGEAEGHPEYNYSSTLIFTLDDKDNIKGWAFDENGYRSIVTYKGRIEGDKILLDGTNPDFTYNQTFELKAGKFVNKRKFKRKGNDAREFEVVYTKK